MAETTTQDRIKLYAQTLDNSIEDDSLLDLVVDEVIDRVLVYTNRIQYVDEATPDTYTTQAVPLKMERIIARAVVGAYHDSVEVLGKPDELGVKSISDNGQTVNYGDRARTYLATTSDQDLLSAIFPLIDNFRVITVVENPA